MKCWCFKSSFETFWHFIKIP